MIFSYKVLNTLLFKELYKMRKWQLTAWAGILLATLAASSCTQANYQPVEVWNKTFGGEMEDIGNSISQTKDGGYVIAGYTMSYGAGSYDYWLLKTDKDGNELWNKTYGSSLSEICLKVGIVDDGGYVLAGNKGVDIWVVKTDKDGNEQWNMMYGGNGLQSISDIFQTDDNGYFIAGDIWTENSNVRKLLLIKTDINGNKVWEKTYGGPDHNYSYSAIQTTDGGYIVSGEVFFIQANYRNPWLIKVDKDGNQEWEKTYSGGSGSDSQDVCQTRDGGYMLTGYAYAGNADVWLLKTDKDGNVTWFNTYGGKDDDMGIKTFQTKDGNYVVCASTELNALDERNLWLIKINASGVVIWEKTFGGTGKDLGRDMCLSNDGGLIIAGETDSYGDKDSDLWLIKIKEEKSTVKPSSQ
jgi:hypothetical protein